jgi:putative transposase
MKNSFRYFNSSPEMVHLAVMMYIRYPLSLRQVEDLLLERGIDFCHETVRFWSNWFGPIFAAETRKRRVQNRSYSHRRWRLDEDFVRINGEIRFLWRTVDHEGEVLEVFATKRRDRKAALQVIEPAMKHYGRPRTIVTDRLLHSLDNPRAETRWEIGHYDETEIFPYENPSSRPRSADVRRANPHRRSLC